MVFLGFGKYVRADRIFALEPIVGEDRGNGRRTLVWVEGMAEAMVASRTQETIIDEMGGTPLSGMPSRDAGYGLAPAGRLKDRALDLARLKREMAHPVVVDLRNIYRAEDMAAHGFTYDSVGRSVR